MENSKHGFREISHVLQPVQKLRIKSKTDELQFANEKRVHFW